MENRREKRIEKVLNLLIIVLLIGVLAAGFYRYSKLQKDVAESIPILTYHRVCSDSEFKHVRKEMDLYTKLSDFKYEMKWLSENGYRTISMDELNDWYEGKIELPKKSVCITFDDGCYNVIRYALPVLKKYNQKACMFVIGDLVGVEKHSLNGIEYIGMKEMQEIRKSYPSFEFQSHTLHMHRNSNADAVVYQYKKKDVIKDMAKMNRKFKDFNMKYIAYPYGYYTPIMLLAEEEKGIKMGFTYNDQKNASRDCNRLLMPRIGIRGDQSVEMAFLRWFE